MKNEIKTSMLALFALAATACGGPTLHPPPTFGEVGGGEYDYRATTPQGVVVAARVEKNKPEANLAFWSRAVDLHLKREGYTKGAEAAVTTDRGLEGTELAYAKDEGGRRYEYVVALFVKSDKVYVVEAGGDKDDFGPAREDVEKAIRSLRQ